MRYIQRLNKGVNKYNEIYTKAKQSIYKVNKYNEIYTKAKQSVNKYNEIYTKAKQR